jgi:hypothetical protein
MVWATARIAPKRAYFEFEDQPAPKVTYTLSLDTHKKNKILNWIKNDGESWG